MHAVHTLRIDIGCLIGIEEPIAVVWQAQEINTEQVSYTFMTDLEPTQTEIIANVMLFGFLADYSSCVIDEKSIMFGP